MAGGINLTQELAQVSGMIELTQSDIASLETTMNTLLTTPASQQSMAEVQVRIAQLKTSLGALRGHESHLKDEINEEKQGRKNQNELAKG